MKFQHTTPMPSGISALAASASMDIAPITFGGVVSPETQIIGVPQMATVGGNSGTTLTIIPGDSADTLSITLDQLLVGWGEVTAIGKFVIQSKTDTPITIFQDKPAGTIVLPCGSIPRFLGDHGLTILNNSTGGEYSITVNYTIKEI